MFNNIELRKTYSLADDIAGGKIEVATFNATLEKNGGVAMFMNINYPHLYEKKKEEVLVAYRQFCADVAAIGATMGLESLINKEDHSTLKELQPITEEFREMATKVFQEVIGELGNVVVNPVPGVYDRYEGGDPYRYNRY